MSILVDRSTRLVVQGITGREGAFHAAQRQAYGTNVVAGVTPGKGGQSAHDGSVPVFDTWSFIAGYKPTSLMNNNFLDPHWNAEGHRLYAAGIARTLRAEGLVPGFTSAPPMAPGRSL